MKNSEEDDRVAVIRLREVNISAFRVANFSEGKESTETVIARRLALKSDEKSAPRKKRTEKAFKFETSHNVESECK